MVWIVMGAAVLVTTLAVGSFVIGIYNRLVSFKNQCDNGFSQIDVQLKRRHDLIPNLVECVKGYLQHERQTLENVIRARNQAVSSLAQAAKNPGDVQAVQSLMASENALTGAVGRLNFVMENYPELKGSENVLALTEELTSTENRIAFARQSYNDWVTAFNTYRETFPAVVFASGCGFPENRPMLEFADPALQDAPVFSMT